jgi:hypothetical protein
MYPGRRPGWRVVAIVSARSRARYATTDGAARRPVSLLANQAITTCFDRSSARDDSHPQQAALIVGPLRDAARAGCASVW